MTCLRLVALSVLGIIHGHAAILPVVLLNGYAGPTCPVSTTQPPSAGDFGNLEALLGQNKIPVVFFDNCAYCPGCTIEDLGKSFTQFLNGLKYSDGTSVPQVDVVGRSMGGLIVRAYLSGIQANGFSPPVTPKIRKAIFIGTPHFGTNIFSSLAGLFPQTSELEVGSAFLSRLATWNQGIDDLRGVDALAIVGNGGTDGYDDGVVSLASSSLIFGTGDQRTRVIPYCHTDPSAFFGLLSCNAGAPFLDGFQDSSHLGFRIIASFLADTADWQSIGNPPSQDPYLSYYGGSYVSLRTANDQAVSLSSVTATGQNDTSATYSLSALIPQVFYQEFIEAQDYGFSLVATDGSTASATATVYSGGILPIPFKYGPFISYATGAAFTQALSVAPGSLLYISGNNLASSSQTSSSLPSQLADASVLVNGKAIGLESVGSDQIQAVLPTGLLGLVTLQVKNSMGSHTVNLMVEPSVPALYNDGSDQNLAYAFDTNSGAAINQKNPARTGQAISLYGTGLGETTRQNGFDYAKAGVTVTIDGINAKVNFTGRSPGDPGVDEMDITVPSGVRSGLRPVYIFAGSRYSNQVFLPVQ